MDRFHPHRFSFRGRVISNSHWLYHTELTSNKQFLTHYDLEKIMIKSFLIHLPYKIPIYLKMIRIKKILKKKVKIFSNSEC